MSTRESHKLSTSDIASADRDIPPADREATLPVQREEEDRARLTDHPQRIDDVPTALFENQEAEEHRTRWGAIQTGFVDEPRKAVEEADTLVAEVMKRLAEIFADERQRLESQWEQADQVSTEDLRLAMRRYRSFFERLLSV